MPPYEEEGGRMIALTPPNVTFFGAEGRLLYIFYRKRGLIVRIRETDQVNVHRALPISTCPKGLQHLNDLGRVRLLLLAPRA